MKKKSIINIKNIILFLLIIITIVVSIVILNTKETVVKGNITIWTDSESYNFLSEASKKFVSENEKCKINIVKVDSDTLTQNLNDAARKNKLPDMITVNSSEINNYLNDENYMGKITNCDFVISKNGNAFSKRELQSVSIDGNYKAIPFTSSPIILYLRQDMLNTYGYSNKDFNTWDDFIRIAKSINEKSDGKVKILNCVGKDREYLISLLTMQAIEELNDKNEEITSARVKEELLNKYTKLNDNNVLNLNENGVFAARLSSVEGMHELSELKDYCEWTANYCPSSVQGGNKFYIDNSKDFIVFNNGEQKDSLINKFISFMSESKQQSSLLLSERLFLSYTSPYDSSMIDDGVNNFSGKNPLIFMANEQKKAPIIPDYDIYTTVKSQVKY